MTLEIGLVLALVALTTLLFVTEWVAYDLTAVFVLGLLVAAGLIGPEEAFSGFSSPATIAIASMLVLSMALNRTGVVDAVASQLEGLAKRSPSSAWLGLLVIVGIASAFINNTAVVAVFIPVVLAMASTLGQSPSKLLMPLSFVSILGGVCTLVGTSTNLLVSSIAVEAGLEPIGMFEVAPMGVLLFACGFTYLVLVGPHVLPDRRVANEDLSDNYEMAEFVSEVEIGEHFSAEGQKQDQRAWLGSRDLDILQIRRDGRALGPEHTHWRRGDVLRVRGSRRALAELLASDDLTLRRAFGATDARLESGASALCEVVVSPDADIVGAPLREAGLLDEHGAHVLAVRHNGVLEHDSLLDRNVRAGDSLLLLVDRDRVNELRRSPQFVVISSHPLEPQRTRRAWLAVLILIGAVGTATAGLAPIALTAFVASALTVATGCLTAEEAYRAINWKVIVMLAGMIPLGGAMETSGAAVWIASIVTGALDGFGPRAVLGGLLLLTMVMTNLMSNVAAAAFLVPIALHAALVMQVEPRPMVMAVMFGASLSFVTPVGYQTNTLVYGPGEYRYIDYARLGVGLSVLCLVVGVLFIPLIWPF